MSTQDKLEDRIRNALTYDAETGILTWKISRPGGVRAGDTAGCWDGKRHIVVQIYGKSYGAHRLAWFLSYGVWPRDQIDHLNGDGTDNRLVNLRECSNAENQQNMRKAQSSNSSGLLGVSVNGNHWRARICINSKNHDLGTFETPQEAHKAYLAAKAKLHPFSTLESV